MVVVFADERRPRPDPEVVTMTYLRYRIVVREHNLTIYSPDGAKLASAGMEFSTARKLIRKHRYDVWFAERERRLAEEAAS